MYKLAFAKALQDAVKMLRYHLVFRYAYEDFMNLDDVQKTMQILQNMQALLGRQDPWIPVYAAIGGALIGGITAIFPNLIIERFKGRRERQDKLMALRREALGAALEWIEPMRNAESRASLLVMSAIQGQVSHEDFLEKFPYILGDLVKRDLPANQRAVLPDNIYGRGHSIIRAFDELQYLGVKYGQEAKVLGKLMAGFQECSTKLEAIRNQIAELESDLKKAFIKTFK